jgi:hypothetical protein
MSDRHEVAAAATFPHDAIARMRQLQQLASRHDRVEQTTQAETVSSVRQHSATATR